MTHGILSFILAGLGMALKDALGVFLVVAESKGRDNLAGICDALGDVAGVIVVIYGAGEVVVHGWNAHTIGVIATIMCVSYIGTRFWTRLARRMRTQEECE